MQELRYHRILLKLGGESLAGTSGAGIDATQALEIAGRIKEVRELGVDVAIVIGNEGNGVSPELQQAADCMLSIPMAGRSESGRGTPQCRTLEWSRNEEYVRR